MEYLQKTCPSTENITQPAVDELERGVCNEEGSPCPFLSKVPRRLLHMHNIPTHDIDSKALRSFAMAGSAVEMLVWSKNETNKVKARALRMMIRREKGNWPSKF